jgi:alpha-N-arabinofuranosidase
MGELSVPAVTASAARGTDGKLYLALANLDPRNAAVVAVDLKGAEAAAAAGQLLTAAAMDARNTFEEPNALQPVAFEAELEEIELPPKSVLVVELR